MAEIQLRRILGHGFACALAASFFGCLASPTSPTPPRGAEKTGQGDNSAPRGTIPDLSHKNCAPGRVTARRLSRTEYARTVADLLGVDVNVTEYFPPDDIGHGFDNLGDALSTSPLLVEKYEEAAARLIDEALLAPSPRPLARAEFEYMHGSEISEQGAFGVLLSRGGREQSFNFPVATTYVLRVRAAEQPAGERHASMVVSLDGAVVATVTVAAPFPLAKIYEIPLVPTSTGAHLVGVSFANDYYAPRTPQKPPRDRNLAIDFVELVGPRRAPGAVSRGLLLPCLPIAGDQACLDEIFTGFAARAWRRPVTEEEVAPARGLVDVALARGEDIEASVALGLRAILLSPRFVFRLEPPGPGRLDARAVATRLAYFLTSSLPDATLTARAADGTLLEPSVLDAEVDRLLAQDASDGLVSALAEQWLGTRALDDADPDPDQFPMVDAQLLGSMKGETQRLVRGLLDEDRPLTELLDARFTWLDDRLAHFYGITIPRDAARDAEGFARVALDGTTRAGILGHASFLTATSFPARTSPVKRGKWVLERLLCVAPPPPPADVPPLGEVGVTVATMRERMEQHRRDPRCAGCHALMDPIGLGLEHFDATGRYRENDQGHPIDDSGELPGGGSFRGLAELAQLLKRAPELDACFTRQVATYALGRGLDPGPDDCVVEGIRARFLERGGTLRALIHAIVESESFLSNDAADVASARGGQGDRGR